MTYTRSILAVLALSIPAFLAAAPTISADLAAAQSEAVGLRASADNLLMLARTPMKYSFEAHATELARARDLADSIAQRVDRMKADREAATPAQWEHMEAMETHLRGVARNVDATILAFHQRNGTASLCSDAYQARVRDLYDGARALANPAPANTVPAD